MGRSRSSEAPAVWRQASSGPHEQSDGLWIGWSGAPDSLTEEQRVSLDAKLAADRLVAVPLTADLVTRYYEGFSNGVLWPLFHYLLDQVPLHVRRLGRLRGGQRALRRGGRRELPARRPDLGSRLPAASRARVSCAAGCPTPGSGSSSTSRFPSEELFRTLPTAGAPARGAARRRSHRLPHPRLPAPLRHLSHRHPGARGRYRPGPTRRPRGAARRVPDGHRRGVVRGHRRRSRGRRGGAGAAGRRQRARCSSASTGSTTPRASRAGCWPSSGCSQHPPGVERAGAAGAGGGAVAHRRRARTRSSGRWWMSWSGGSTAPSARRAGRPVHYIFRALSRPRSWWRSTAPPTSCW